MARYAVVSKVPERKPGQAVWAPANKVINVVNWNGQGPSPASGVDEILVRSDTLQVGDTYNGS